jgi:acyl-CoA synthetase (AMP-forming)/AMP-acid ligase II
VRCSINGPAPESKTRAARKRLSSFKVPTVWVLVDSDEDIPRGTTGKVDVRRLREMLNAEDGS